MGLGSRIRDPGSGKNLFRIPDPGVKKAPDPGSRSATLGDGGIVDGEIEDGVCDKTFLFKPNLKNM